MHGILHQAYREKSALEKAYYETSTKIKRLKSAEDVVKEIKELYPLNHQDAADRIITLIENRIYDIKTELFRTWSEKLDD